MGPVFVTGGSGYLGGPLIELLLKRGHRIDALVRSGSERKLPPGARPIVGNALDATTFAAAVPPGATLVHLVGTPHPSPAKAKEFQRVDLASITASVTAAQHAAVSHFVYVSVAHPAPVMKAFIAVRQAGEDLIRESGIRATILRPWYVLGPGHWWPYLIAPVYGVLRWFAATREGAERLGLVTHRAMVAALAHAVENPPVAGVRIVEVPDIRRSV